MGKLYTVHLNSDNINEKVISSLISFGLDLNNKVLILQNKFWSKIKETHLAPKF